MRVEHDGRCVVTSRVVPRWADEAAAWCTAIRIPAGRAAGLVGSPFLTNPGGRERVEPLPASSVLSFSRRNWP